MILMGKFDNSFYSVSVLRVTRFLSDTVKYLYYIVTWLSTLLVKSRNSRSNGVQPESHWHTNRKSTTFTKLLLSPNTSNVIFATLLPPKGKKSSITRTALVSKTLFVLQRKICLNFSLSTTQRSVFPKFVLIGVVLPE